MANASGSSAGSKAGGMTDKGATDCSGNPNYPAAAFGDAYVVSVAGKIGGGSGASVDVGDVFFATAANAGGTQASVGTSWAIIEHNLVGALVSGGALGTPSSGTLTNCTGLPASTGISGLGTGVATALGINVGSAGAPVTNGGALGTPSAGTGTNLTGVPISTGISGLGASVATQLANAADGTNVSAVGFRGIPQNSQSAG